MAEPDIMTTVDALDDDLRAACHDRSEAWCQLVIKDTPAHRDSYDDACAQVDGLLEMRHEMSTGMADHQALADALVVP